MRSMLIDIASARRKLTSLSGFFVVFGTSQAVFAESMYGAFVKYVWILPPMLLSIPGKKLLLRSILSCRKFCSDAVFCVLWMSTMYFIAGFGSRRGFDAHQPSRRLYCSVWDEPAPAP